MRCLYYRTLNYLFIMNVSVIGGGGFLGGCLARSLVERGDKVLILGRNSYPKIRNSIQSIKVDIRDRNNLIKALKNQEVVFHTAAIPSIWGNYNDFYSIDVQGTKNIIFACNINNIKKLIFTSSPSVIFNQ